MVIITKYIERKKKEKINKEALIALDKIATSLREEIDNFETIIDRMNKEYKVEETPILINQFLFFRISFCDIVGILKQLVKVQDEHEENLLCRTLSLNLYEFIDDTKDFLGPKMKEGLSGLPNESYLISELYKLKKYYWDIRKNNLFNDLAEVRHNTVGHKDMNSIRVSRMIKNISSVNIAAICFVVFMLFSLIINFQHNIFFSIKNQIDKEESVADKNKNESDKEVTSKKRRGVEAEFKRMLLKIKGVAPDFADVLCEVTPETIKKLEELIEYLNNKNEQS